MPGRFVTIPSKFFIKGLLHRGIDMVLSRMADELKPSGTIGVTTKINQMVKAGVSIIGFGMGEPDFDTPDNIKKAAIKAIEEGFTKYTPTAGIPELREAICEKLWRENGLRYNPSQIVVSAGAKQSIHNLILVLCNEGDEALIPTPYWVSYPEQVKMAGARPVFIPTTEETDFKVTPEALKKAITSRTKLLIINSPSNPAGVVYTESELRELVGVAINKGLYVISDEIYEKITYHGLEHCSPARLDEEFMKRVITVNGFSKSYAMTGWRLGYAAGPENIMKATVKVQDHTTSCPSSIAQKAGLEALKGDQGFMDSWLKEYDGRRLYIVERLNRMKGISCLLPKGAFYVFPNISRLYHGKLAGNKISNSTELVELLIEKAGVAFVPGVCFGSEDHVRISFATDIAQIEEGMDRLERFLSS